MNIPTDIPAEDKNKIINVINSLIPDAKIYLYGSRARGTHSKWSDIDLALESKNTLTTGQIGELNDVMASLSIPYTVNIVDLHAVSPTIKDSILKDKISWKI